MEHSSAHNYWQYKPNFLRKGKAIYPYDRVPDNNTVSLEMIYIMREPSVYIKGTALRCLQINVYLY